MLITKSKNNTNQLFIIIKNLVITHFDFKKYLLYKIKDTYINNIYKTIYKKYMGPPLGENQPLRSHDQNRDF